jgi:hypothetical protein
MAVQRAITLAVLAFVEGAYEIGTAVTCDPAPASTPIPCHTSHEQ